MQLELGRFLQTIQVGDDVYAALNDATLLSGTARGDKKGFIAEIAIPAILDLGIYERLREAGEKLSMPCEFVLRLEKDKTFDDLALNAYFLYFVKKSFHDTPLYETLSRLKLVSANGQIILTLNSRLLQESIDRFRDLLATEFINAGFNAQLVVQLQELQPDEVNKLMEQAKEDQMKTFTSLIDLPSQTEPSFSRRRRVAKNVRISDDLKQGQYVQFTGRAFQIERREFNGKPPIFSLYTTDDQDSIIVRVRPSRDIPLEFLEGVKEEDWLDVVGRVDVDNYLREIIIVPNRLEKVADPAPRRDTEEEKRIELHLHTNYSTLDGVCTIEKYAKTASEFGHKALAITDLATVQGFPEAQAAAKKYDLKMVYGMEGYTVDGKYTPALVSADIPLSGATYVCFDLETTGLNPRYDEIIEIGAVKYKDNQKIDSFQTFVNPKRRISPFSVNLCGITDEDVLGAPTLEEVASSFRRFVGDAILVAHNARFDYTFINEALRKRLIPILNNPVIDSLDLAHCVLPKRKSYSLGAVSRALNVDYDEISAHRADYDAQVLGDVLMNLLSIAEMNFHVKNLQDLNSLSPEDAYLDKHPYHITFLVRNEKGLKNLYRIVSEANTRYFRKYPLIPRKLIEENRDGLLIGSGDFEGELFDIARTGTEEALRRAMRFYDYIEIQPLANYSYLIATGAIENEAELIRILKDIVRLAEVEHKLIVATGDCHYLHPRDRIARDAYIAWHPKNQKAFHPLFDSQGRIKQSPEQHFRTTREMLNGVGFVGEEKAREYVIYNPRKIVNAIDYIEPTHSGASALKVPRLPGIDAQEEMEKMCFANARKKYGADLPPIVQKRLDDELRSLRENNYAVIYYLAYKLVQKSKSDGYLVGSRGSVGSSFVATMSGITEVNPLPPHYYCPACHYFELVDDGSYASGYDLPLKMCPHCGRALEADGQNIPFATFLGFHGDKVPDIDLNFSGDYQAQAHEYTKELLDEDHVFRAGTISCIQEQTAFGVARNYFEYHEKFDVRRAEYARVAHYCAGTKRTTGQHPGGIVVVPLEDDILDFTPVQYPADDVNARWKTTHLTYESIHDELLKLDILGHDDPTALKMLKELTGVDPESIPLNDPRVLSLFTSTKALGVTPGQIFSETGVSGVPEFGTENTKRILKDAKPTKFSELVQISGLSHGTDVWSGNAQELIQSGKATLMQCIGCRDDVMTYLTSKGLDPLAAFKIMENVRKKDRNVTPQQEEDMRAHGVPEFYIESAKKIKYMFPKAHAVAYVSMALRIAWYKVYYPIEYYATFFSVRCPEYKIEEMIEGGAALKRVFDEALNVANDRGRKQSERKKASDLYDVLLLAIEFRARGFKFANVSLTESESKVFKISSDRLQLIPPFDSIAGLGEEAARSVVEARKIRPFVSKEDLLKRTKINKTQLKALDDMGALRNLGEEAQLSLNLFDD